MTVTVTVTVTVTLLSESHWVTFEALPLASTHFLFLRFFFVAVSLFLSLISFKLIFPYCSQSAAKTVGDGSSPCKTRHRWLVLSYRRSPYGALTQLGAVGGAEYGDFLDFW
jgi:hypothetical protein